MALPSLSNLNMHVVGVLNLRASVHVAAAPSSCTTMRLQRRMSGTRQEVLSQPK